MPLLTDGNIETGFVRKKRPFFSNLKKNKRIPKLALDYAKEESRITGLPLREVVKSNPVEKYIKKLEEKVQI